MFKTAVAALASLAVLAGCASQPEESQPLPGSGAVVRPAPPAAREAAAAPTALKPGSLESFILTVGDRIFFATDSTTLDPEARQVLDRQATWLKQNAGKILLVEGHADERGTREYNLALGEKRAVAVRDYLAAQGIDAARLRTISYGKEHPAVLGATEQAWARNRRTVSVVE